MLMLFVITNINMSSETTNYTVKELTELKDAANKFIDAIMPVNLSINEPEKNTIINHFLGINDDDDINMNKWSFNPYRRERISLPFSRSVQSNLAFKVRECLSKKYSHSRCFSKPSDYHIETYVKPDENEFGKIINVDYGVTLQLLSAPIDARIQAYKRWRFVGSDAHKFVFVRKTEPYDNPARCSNDWTSVLKSGGWGFLANNGGLVEVFRGYNVFEGFEFPGECKPTKVLLYLGSNESAELPLVNGSTISDSFYLPLGCMSHIHCCFRFIFSESSPFDVSKFQVNLIFGDFILSKIHNEHFKFTLNNKVVRIAERFFASINSIEADNAMEEERRKYELARRK